MRSLRAAAAFGWQRDSCGSHVTDQCQSHDTHVISDDTRVVTCSRVLGRRGAESRLAARREGYDEESGASEHRMGGEVVSGREQKSSVDCTWGRRESGH